MAKVKGYTVELSSDYEGWWRYNAAILCGAFDAEGGRIGFMSVQSDVAEAGSNLTKKPAGAQTRPRVALTAPPCDHLMLYIYIIPHTLPLGKEIDAARCFEAELIVSRDGKKLCSERLSVNQWSGVSLERRIGREQ